MSEPAIQSRKQVRFGLFELDLYTRELRKSGLKIRLQEQPFQLLAMLLERPGEIVTREELRKRLWPSDTFVAFDLSLNSAVKKLRKSLSDDSENPRFIETLYRRGYRFIGTVNGSTKSAYASESSETVPATPLFHEDSNPKQQRMTSDRARRPWISAVFLLVAASAGVFAWFSRPIPPPRVLNITPVTHDGVTTMSVLTDSSLLYIVESTGSKQFLVQASVAGSDSAVIPTPFANIAISDISPDHSQLLVGDAVGTGKEGAAWVLPLPAGTPRRLGEVVSRPDAWSTGWAKWSPDGRQLAFARGPDIYTANADGTNIRPLIALPGPGYAEGICFSPDGTRLRFNLRELQSDSSSIWEVRSNGSNLHPVLPGWHSPPSEFAGVWSPDGRYYFFTSATSPDRVSIWAVREVGGPFHRWSSQQPVQLTSGPMPVFLVGISGDGRRLFAGGWSSRSELVRYDNRSHLFVPFLGGISAGEVDFSRDGKWVAYVSDGTLWRSRVDGRERLQLTSPPVSAFLPRWSPDGTQIAYVDNRAGQLWKVFLISEQGGIPRAMLSEDQNEMDPSWSPDGTQLVFGRVPWLREGRQEIAIQLLDLKSGMVSAIPGSENQFAPRWSPDGQHLAAVSSDGKTLRLFDFKTKKWTDWIEGFGTVGYPSWSRDGRYLYYDDISGKNPGYRRIEIGSARPDFFVDVKSLHRGFSHAVGPLGPWSGITPDGSPLFDRDLSTDAIYSLEVQLP
jgi:Tol biopolymer transport system component/DNA-binding winged helix-turn-helix (wHTH) protein